MDDPVGVPRLVASLRAGRGPRRYDEERGCYVYDVSFTASPPLTGRVRGVAEAFGVALDDRRQVLYRDFELRLGERDVVYVTGDSGSGKSVLLRALREDLGGEAVDIAEAAVEDGRPIVETVGSNQVRVHQDRGHNLHLLKGDQRRPLLGYRPGARQG
jgi:ATPase subunit of ABC transporter with duplicated ATPase domains